MSALEFHPLSAAKLAVARQIAEHGAVYLIGTKRGGHLKERGSKCVTNVSARRFDAGRSPTAPCGEASTLMNSQAERRLTND
jgi:hypothetical protein